jgi:hypothetical protein
MKNIFSLILILIAISCSAQRQAKIINLGNNSYGVSTEDLKQNYKSIRYSNIQNYLSGTVPGYASEQSEQFFDQNLFKVDDKQVIKIIRGVVNGGIISDSFKWKDIRTQLL